MLKTGDIIQVRAMRHAEPAGAMTTKANFDTGLASQASRQIAESVLRHVVEPAVWPLYGVQGTLADYRHAKRLKTWQEVDPSAVSAWEVNRASLDTVQFRKRDATFLAAEQQVDQEMLNKFEDDVAPSRGFLVFSSATRRTIDTGSVVISELERIGVSVNGGAKEPYISDALTKGAQDAASSDDLLGNLAVIVREGLQGKIAKDALKCTTDVVIVGHQPYLSSFALRQIFELGCPAVDYHLNGYASMYTVPVSTDALLHAL